MTVTVTATARLGRQQLESSCTLLLLDDLLHSVPEYYWQRLVCPLQFLSRAAPDNHLSCFSAAFIYACTLMDWTRRRQRHYNSGKRITSYTIDIILDFISIGMWLSMVVITAIALSQRSKSAIQVDNVDDLVVDYAMTDSSLKALCAMCALLLVTSGLACHDSVSMKAQCAVPPAAPQDAGKNSECPVSLELTLNVS